MEVTVGNIGVAQQKVIQTLLSEEIAEGTVRIDHTTKTVIFSDLENPVETLMERSRTRIVSRRSLLLLARKVHEATNR